MGSFQLALKVDHIISCIYQQAKPIPSVSQTSRKDSDSFARIGSTNSISRDQNLERQNRFSHVRSGLGSFRNSVLHGYVSEHCQKADKSKRGTCLNTCIRADLSGEVLARVATVALQSRLAAHEAVETRIDCTFRGLLGGRVEGVQILGRAWQSPLNLSCRTLDVQVTAVQLDVRALVTRQMIALKSTPKGSASITFSAADFANFLAHPLMVKASKTAVDGQPFLFSPHRGVEIKDGSDPFRGLISCVSFHGMKTQNPYVLFEGVWASNPYLIAMGVGEGPKEVNLRVQRRNKTQLAVTKPVTETETETEMELETEKGLGIGTETTMVTETNPDTKQVRKGLELFFRNLALELDGTVMQFDGMEFVTHVDIQGRSEFALRLDLQVVVYKFPPPNVNF